jgi:hypothetical protein
MHLFANDGNTNCGSWMYDVTVMCGMVL